MPLLRDVQSHIGSSYLLDHVDNPVLWRTWSDDTLAEAAALDRPIFLSIGYAACHWCHVMAHESFENVDVAEILNTHFIPIKVDREERPDVDALYMAATQLVSGHGGWPMSVFLLPDGRPFMAGTYYPPTDRGGQIGFTRLLHALDDAWQNQRSLIEEQASNLSSALSREVQFIDHLEPHSNPLDMRSIRELLRDELVKQVDTIGGFGSAPKFPRPSFVEALVHFDDTPSKGAVQRTLDVMSREGLYDHFGGGFARYSVDGEWHVPHFEKMLSDQALLARCYLRASTIFRNDEWRDVALDTLAFVARDLSRSDGYASSLDADANGVEGSHITWTQEEFADVLRSPSVQSAAVQRWRIEPRGSFEGRSIPRLAANEGFRTPDSLGEAHAMLISSRTTRPQPSRDEKVVLEWNAMLASAFLVSNDTHFEQLGFDLLNSLSLTHHSEDVWWRTERHQAHATASDIACLINALIDAYERTGDDEWLAEATQAVDYLLEHYWDGDLPTVLQPHRGGGIFSQSDLVHDLHTRPKELFDGATPSAHALSTRAIARVALCRGDSTLLGISQRLVELAGSLLISHPAAIPDLVEAAGFAFEGVEIVIPGPPSTLAHHVRSLAMPRTVLITGLGASPLLRDRRIGLAYVCRGGVCALPVATIEDLDDQLTRMLN